MFTAQYTAIQKSISSYVVYKLKLTFLKNKFKKEIKYVMKTKAID